MAISICHAQWPRDRHAIRALRTTVFVEEQNVAPELEWDGLDDECDHVLIFDADGSAVATGRLQANGKIGRMAVLKSHRRQGLGGAVLAALLKIAANRGLDQVYLHAQTHALDFYLAKGFTPCGAAFEEAGIAHQKMRLMLKHPQ
ncbi:MAG: GNAT family N-acetyltransferase [Gammaproteobacteria bacterium]|nr:GNAT family N-acetyltransferase [Gammaproteobacteria bacterium]